MFQSRFRFLPLLFFAAVAQAEPAHALDKQRILSQLVRLAPRLAPKVADTALRAAICAEKKMKQSPPEKLVIIDYSLPSTEKRFWMFDLVHVRLLAEEYVAHGRNTGMTRAEKFSNTPGSLQSSLGLFRVGAPYTGKHGNSLELFGLERGFNDLAKERAIVLHGAEYVSDDFLRAHQRLGRSWGCPVLSEEAAPKVIDYFREGAGFLFVYYPDNAWLRQSPLQNGC